MSFSRTNYLVRWIHTASLLSLSCAAHVLNAAEPVPLPAVKLAELVSLPAVLAEEVVSLPEAISTPLDNSQSIVCSPVCSPTCPPRAILDSPRPVDLCFEAIPRLLSLPNERIGDCFACALHSPRVEVPTLLDDFPIGIQPLPERPPLLLEWGERFLSPDPLKPGIETPFGAVWRPALWVFGEYRTALQYSEYGEEPITEWANRLDLFGQLNLSGTERVLLGLRPLDEELSASRRFSGADIREGRSINGFNSQIQTLFFEGDFGEIFPRLDPHDVRSLDYGFSIGRMPLLAQQGLLINEDRIDAVTVTKNTLFTKRILNLRMTGVYAWNNVNRNSPEAGIPNRKDNHSQLFALLTESDFAHSTVNADVVYVQGDSMTGDLVAYGISSIRRHQGYFNTYNTSLHLLGSFSVNGDTAFSQQGELLFAQTSWTPHHHEDLIYLNAFLAIDQFTSPARGTQAGGPLGQTGLLFSAPGIGRVGAPIDVRANDAAGASLGYQFFFDETRQQLVWEFGGQQDTDGTNRGALATGMRYQRALGQHWIAILDATVGKRESTNTASSVRFEARAKF